MNYILWWNVLDISVHYPIATYLLWHTDIWSKYLLSFAYFLCTMQASKMKILIRNYTLLYSLLIVCTGRQFT